jgi:hypothetical protein
MMLERPLYIYRVVHKSVDKNKYFRYELNYLLNDEFSVLTSVGCCWFTYLPAIYSVQPPLATMANPVRRQNCVAKSR